MNYKALDYVNGISSFDENLNIPPINSYRIALFSLEK